MAHLVSNVAALAALGLFPFTALYLHLKEHR